MAWFSRSFALIDRNSEPLVPVLSSGTALKKLAMTDNTVANNIVIIAILLTGVSGVWGGSLKLELSSAIAKTCQTPPPDWKGTSG